MEERRPGMNPFIGRGKMPMVPRFVHWERVLGNNNNGHANSREEVGCALHLHNQI